MTPQTLTIKVHFTTEHKPATDEHLDQILENYFRGKGVNYKEGVITI